MFKNFAWAALAAVALCSPMAHASGSKKIETTPMAEPTAEALTPEQQAIQAYNEGLERRDEAWKLTAKLESVPEGEREKLTAKVRKKYEDAIRDFRRAVEQNPRLHQAHASLGYVYRQTGDYTAALAAYDRALAIAPDYVEAVEYRGEAYLGLGRIDDAKTAWEALQQKKSPLEMDLLKAMHTWVAARRQAPGEISVGTLDAFERWIDERQAGRPLAGPSTLKKSGW